jgi:hypothetical protein
MQATDMQNARPIIAVLDHTTDEGEAALKEFGFGTVQLAESAAPRPGPVADRLRGLVAELERATDAGDLGGIVNGVAAVRRLMRALDAWAAWRAELDRIQPAAGHLTAGEVLDRWYEGDDELQMPLERFRALLRSDRRLACLLLSTASVAEWMQDGEQEVARVVGLFFERDFHDDGLLVEMATYRGLIKEEDCDF